MTMKAAVVTQFGPPEVLHIKQVAKPTPKDTEVLVRIRATSINYGDTLARNFKNVSPREFNMPRLMWLPARLAFGLRKPRVQILGNEFAGDVEAVGKDVTRFKPGDAVFGYVGQRMGANAEYLTVPENGVLVSKPAILSYEEAASIPGGAVMALGFIRKMNIQRGQKVLINGASGGIGMYALQLARHYGAEVTGVCSTPRVELVKALGANHVIDYTKEDFTRNGETYDLILDVLGRTSFGRCKRSLTKNGRLYYVSFKMKQVRQMLRTSMIGRKKVKCVLVTESTEALAEIKNLIEAGVVKAIVDRCYPLEQAAEAHRYVENGGKRGSVVLTIAHRAAG